MIYSTSEQDKALRSLGLLSDNGYSFICKQLFADSVYELSEKQTSRCVCGFPMPTTSHEDSCKRFNERAMAKVIAKARRIGKKGLQIKGVLV